MFLVLFSQFAYKHDLVLNYLDIIAKTTTEIYVALSQILHRLKTLLLKRKKVKRKRKMYL